MDNATINKIRAQIAAFETRLAEARATMGQISAAIAEVESAPPSREECLASFETALAPLAAQDRRPKLEPWARRWIAVDPSMREKDIEINVGPMIRGGDWDNLILPLLWPVLREQFAAIIEEMDWPENALNATERQRRLDALEPQRRAAESALNALESQAQKLGIR